ncbi:hypothetical protein [Mesorhizobium sp. WSM2239]|uniref:Tail assembly chaperone n=2 Tax=unclassified Mesorhizobium TaxID=325217 RepID=A0AAU8D487_9HYPH
MRLADEITITIAGEAVVLVPALRHAIRLERRPGSFSGLAREIIDGSLSAACDIIGDHTDMPFLESRVLDELDRLKEPLLQYVMALAGIDPEDRPHADATRQGRKPRDIPFKEYQANLYRIGTGWLGWTPETALDATPAEILEAYRGRLDMLKAIFGSSEEPDDKPSPLSLDDKFKIAFGSFGTTKVHRKKAA